MITSWRYVVEPVAPLGVGMCGRLAVRVGKDRPGRVRGHGGAWRKADRTQAVAVAVIDSTDPARIVYTLEPPAREVDPEEARAQLDHDRRASILDLTESGNTILDRTRDHRRSRMQVALAAWPENDRVEFGRLLKQFNSSVDSLIEEA